MLTATNSTQAMRPILFVGILAVTVVSAAPVASTIDSELKHAYGANLGWISLRHDQPTPGQGIVVGTTFCSGYAYAANVGWINFGNGHPADGVAYSNTSNDDFGVNIDPEGRLSGYAYGANIGWISFQWHAESADASDWPSINLSDGTFSGYAYGTNVGWINLGTGFLRTDLPALVPLLLHGSVADNTLTLSWTGPADGVVQTSADWASGAWVTVGGGLPRPGGGWFLEIPIVDSDPVRFFRWSRD